MTRGQKIMVGTAGAALLAVGVYAGFGKSVNVNMVDVEGPADAPRLARTFRVDVKVTEHCDRLREAYEDAVAAVLASAPEGRTIGSLTPDQVKRIADARRPFGEVPAGEAKDVVALFPDEGVARLATGTTPVQSNWYGIKY